MIISLRISKEKKRVLLLKYPSVRFFIQKAITDQVNKIIIERKQFDIEKELKEYHNRKVLNDYGIHNRKHTQKTKDKIKNTLKEKYKGKHYPLLEETRILIGLKHKGKILSQATKDAISKANTGKKRTKEQRKNISKAKTGQKYKKHKVKIK